MLYTLMYKDGTIQRVKCADDEVSLQSVLVRQLVNRFGWRYTLRDAKQTVVMEG